MKVKHVFVGLFFVGSGLAMILHAMGFLAEISVMTLLITALLVPVLVYSAIKLQFFGAVFSLAFLFLMYAEFLGLPSVNLWMTLLVALLVSIGLQLIFHPKQWVHRCQEHHWEGSGPFPVSGDADDSTDSNVVNYSIRFGSNIKYVNSECLEKAYLSASFAELKVFFDNATLHPEGGEIYLDASFSGMELYLPKHWHVVNRAAASFGSLNEENRAVTTENSPRLTINGSVHFAGVSIIYV